MKNLEKAIEIMSHCMDDQYAVAACVEGANHDHLMVDGAQAIAGLENEGVESIGIVDEDGDALDVYQNCIDAGMIDNDIDDYKEYVYWCVIVNYKNGVSEEHYVPVGGW